MKKIFMALLAMSFSLPAFAEWVSYHRNADVEEFYDNKFVSRDGGVIRLWTMSDYAKPITSLEGQELLSEKFFTTVDCTSRKTGSEKVMKYAGHRADGKLLATMDTVLRLTNIRQGSSDEVLMNHICR